jgi:predicted ATPase
LPDQSFRAPICVLRGCILEAIEQVCSGDPAEPEAVVDLLTGLVARSLVVAEDDCLGTRYRLLETIRQYGEERLAEWGETETLRIQHARFYAALLAQQAERFFGPEQIAWATQINPELDNIRTALAKVPTRTLFSRHCARLVTSSPPHSATSADASFVPPGRR